MKNLHFVFIATKSSLFDIPMQLEAMGYEVTILEHYQFDAHAPVPEEELAPVHDVLSKGDVDYVVTYLFHPVISSVCLKYNVTYIAWVYDSPQHGIFTPELQNENNRIFIFDRMFCERLMNIDVKNIYHLPLCANVDRVAVLDLTDEDEKKYACDISFAGSLYATNLYNINIDRMPPDIKEMADAYLDRYLCDWHEIREWPTIDHDTCEHIFTKDAVSEYERSSEFPSEFFYGIKLFSRKLAEMERRTVLDRIAKRWDVQFYSGKDLIHDPHIHYHNSVNYYTDLPKLYYFSKINLNITIPTIETGLPQRIFDIMAAGGFVLTNFQEEILDYFDIGRDIEVFRDLDELEEKIEYYLSHEEERLRIAMNGYQKVRDEHDYKKRFAEVLQLCGQDVM